MQLDVARRPEGDVLLAGGGDLLGLPDELPLDRGEKVLPVHSTDGEGDRFGAVAHKRGMVDAGLTPLQAIRIATQNGAETLGLKDRGTLARDKRADFIVLDANPLDNIVNSRKISAVYHDGIAVDRVALRTAWTGSAPTR